MVRAGSASITDNRGEPREFGQAAKVNSPDLKVVALDLSKYPFGILEEIQDLATMIRRESAMPQPRSLTA